MGIEKVGVKRRKVNNCACGKDSYIYTLPMRLKEDIMEFMGGMGTPAFSFKKTSLLKIENPSFVITGVKQLKDIRLTIKKKDKSDQIIAKFEKIIASYMTNGSKE